MAAYSTYENIVADVDDGVVTLTLNEPDKYNPINTETLLDLRRAFDEIQLDRDIDVVVITGAGEKSFSSGGDIREYAGPSEEHDPVERERQDLYFDTWQKLYDLHPVTIAKINGYCVGGGLILMSYCDLSVSVDDAKFGVPTTDIGQIPGDGSTYRITQLVGEQKVKELVYTANLIDAEEAYRIGLVNRITPRDELDAAVGELVDAIQDTGRQAVKNSKKAINYSVRAPDLETAHEHESQLWWEQFATEEREELVDEFLE
ncbi:enoyl-CoA hydratase/isomerase family protein [Halorussus salinisoli]|uniref:enoyl-CoA hydratase/isomerase family protein n=1 Tax=Halorussus salinisoli TaxID=2558242 RepID=UPI0010C21815|nr:enoyl-CoA hydratase/isomerase family protein [Halorussus salinisoli]